MHRILDTKYTKANHNKVMNKQYQHLNDEERKRLLILLRNFEDLFSGKLGMCNTTPVDLELKYDVNPVFLRPYPVPRIPKSIFRK